MARAQFGTAASRTASRRGAVDVARVLALLLVVVGHLTLAVIDRHGGHVRGTNLLRLHPGWAFAVAAAPMPVFFAAGGYANATATFREAARRLRSLAAIGAVVVTAWSAAVAITVLVAGDAGIVGDGARLATQPLWFVAAYAPFAAAGTWLARVAARHPVVSIGGAVTGLLVLDTARFALGAPEWVGWPGFLLAWGVPWLAGGWWRDRYERGALDEHRTGIALAAAGAAACIVLVAAFGYAPALIDAVPGARSNTTPPTLYTAAAGLAQVGVLLLVARWLDGLAARWRRLWRRAGEVAVAVYAWHLTALALCAAAIAAGAPAPERLTPWWWATRPLWWAAVLAVTIVFVAATGLLVGSGAARAPSPATRAGTGRQIAGVLVLAAAGAVAGLEGPRALPSAFGLSALFVSAWLFLRGRRQRRGGHRVTEGPVAHGTAPTA